MQLPPLVAPPPGWFHEVTSYGSIESSGHMAFNYWFHPPDNPDPSPAGCSAPYTSAYWPSLWAGRCGTRDCRAAVAGQDAKHDGSSCPGEWLRVCGQGWV